MISFVVAYARNRVMGLNQQLPWKISEDLKYFKKITMGHSIVMGRKTYESIGRPLPGRKNIILTRDQNYSPEGYEVFNNIDDLLHHYNGKDLYVIGGAEIFAQLLPYTDRLYITYIEADFMGDTYFPDFDLKEWRLVSRKPGLKNEANPFDYYFLVYDRK